MMDFFGSPIQRLHHLLETKDKLPKITIRMKESTKKNFTSSYCYHCVKPGSLTKCSKCWRTFHKKCQPLIAPSKKWELLNNSICMFCSLKWQINIDEVFKYRIMDEDTKDGEIGMGSLLMSRSKFIRKAIMLDEERIEYIKNLNVDQKSKPVSLRVLLDLCFQYQERG